MLAIVSSAQVETSFKELNLDSLEKANAAYQKEDAAKLTLLNQLTFSYSNVDPNKGLETGDQAIALAQKLNKPLLLAEVYHNLGLNFAANGDYVQASELYEKALAINQSLNNKYGIAHNTYHLGDIYNLQEDFVKALEYFENAFKQFEERRNLEGVAVAYRGMGYAHHNLSNFQKAVEFFQKALNINEQLGDMNSMAINLIEIGHNYYHLSDYPKALEFHQKGLSINEKLGSKRGIITSLYQVGFSYASLSNYTKALEFSQKAEDFKKQIGDNVIGIADELRNRGNIYSGVSDYQKALESYQKSLDISEQLGDTNDIATTFGDMGNAYLNLSDFPNALEYYQKSLSIKEQLGKKTDIAKALDQMGNVYTQLSDFPKALEYYQKALNISEQLGQKGSIGFGMAGTLFNMGKVYINLSDYPKALEYFKKSLDLIKQTGNKSGQSHALLNIGNIYRDAPDAVLMEMEINSGDRYDIVLKYYNKSLQIAQEIGDLGQQKDAWQNLNQTYVKQNDITAAYDTYKNYVNLRDSIQGEEAKKQFLRKEMQYEFDKKETELKFQQQLTDEQLQKQQLLNRQQRWLYLPAGIAILGIAGLLATLLWYARKKHELLRQQKESEQRETVRLKELDRLKTVLYTNITHEFRTPLTVISGVAAELNNNREVLEPAVQTIQRNSARLLNLVNQMLDLSKLQSGMLSLNLVNGDVVQYSGYIVQSFQSLAAARQITLHFLPEMETFPMDYDPEKTMQILSNLISNAIKFTPANGNVYVHLSAMHDNAQLQIKVQDTGIGITKEHLPHIFDRFYQVEDAYRVDKGTGIGLALTKELVELLGGEITVQSRTGKGSVFAVTLPVTQSAMDDAVEYQPASVREAVSSFAPAQISGMPVQNESYSLREIPRLLIIEDTPDVISYLRMCLDKDYRITEAHDGGEGIEAAINTIPDIVVTDVMMPVKDGYEVCKTLKEDERTSHIPIIMLTARADTPSKLEGLETGADAYLYKPFEKEELQIRLRKLLELRVRLQRRYTSDESPPPVESRSVEREDQFIHKLKQIIHSHLDDADYGILQLCREMQLSRSQLHNKIKALTGRSTSLYIRLIRLQKARELLKDPQMHVSEVAYATGFRDPAYFTRCFVEEYGVNPSEFRNALR